MQRGGGGIGGGWQETWKSRRNELNVVFLPQLYEKRRAMGSEGFFSKSLSQVIHHGALSKELSTTWDEQWHCDCRDGRALDWKISAIRWASQRRPKARGGGLKVEEEEGVGREWLADENQKILTLRRGCLESGSGLQIWLSSWSAKRGESLVEVEQRNFQITFCLCVTESSAALEAKLNASWTYASCWDQTCWVYLARQVRS